MTPYDFRLTVIAPTLGQAREVVTERLMHDEDYGFAYTIEVGDMPEPVVAQPLGAAEAQELHEAIGAAIETGDVSALPRARELAALLVADTSGDDVSLDAAVPLAKRAAERHAFADGEAEDAYMRAIERMEWAAAVESAVASDPKIVADRAFRMIDEQASRARETIEPNSSAIVVDGSHLSPSMRALPGAEPIYQEGGEDWEAFCECFDSHAEAWNEHGYTLMWEDGILFVVGPQWTPED